MTCELDLDDGETAPCCIEPQNPFRTPPTGVDTWALTSCDRALLPPLHIYPHGVDLIPLMVTYQVAFNVPRGTFYGQLVFLNRIARLAPGKSLLTVIPPA